MTIKYSEKKQNKSHSNMTTSKWWVSTIDSRELIHKLGSTCEFVAFFCKYQSEREDIY